LSFIEYRAIMPKDLPKIWVYIVGLGDPNDEFTVVANDSHDVDDLKKFIRIEKSNRLDNRVKDSDLTLYKVDLDANVSRLAQVAQQAIEMQPGLQSIRLNPRKKLSELFDEHPAEHDFNIVVQLPKESLQCEYSCGSR
jgi:hypothetical protein